LIRGIKGTASAKTLTPPQTEMADERPEWLNYWLVWGDMGAVHNDNLHSINPDILSRHSPRILQGVAQLCDYFDKARDKLK